VRTVSRATIGRQQPQQRPPVLIARRPRRSHAGNLPGDGRSSPSRPGTDTTALAARPAAHTAADLHACRLGPGQGIVFQNWAFCASGGRALSQPGVIRAVGQHLSGRGAAHGRAGSMRLG
jgi:hypothetical protein